MKSQRFLALFLAIVCVGLAWGILHRLHVPLATPVAAQGSGQMDVSGSILPTASAAVRKAAAASITAQLKAFQENDYQKAEQYQSSNLKRNFTSVARFRQMMTTAYPEFAHYKSVRFNDARADPRSRHVWMQVTLIGQDGVTVRAVYMMVKEEGLYRVDGVMGGGRAPLPVSPGGSVDS